MDLGELAMERHVKCAWAELVWLGRFIILLLFSRLYLQRFLKQQLRTGIRRLATFFTPGCISKQLSLADGLMLQNAPS